MIYVVIENDTIVNLVVCDDEQLAQSQGWIQNDQWQIGWVRSGESFQSGEE